MHADEGRMILDFGPDGRKETFGGNFILFIPSIPVFQIWLFIRVHPVHLRLISSSQGSRQT